MSKEKEIAKAVAVLRGGGLVAFATETVYGLGADARNPDAVRRIFAVKGRPGTNPLIVHVADRAAARRWAGQWPQAAEALAKKFWPGPLTIVVPRGQGIADEVTAGLATVALRAPRHEVAQELLKKFDGPVAAPSANRSRRVSPTTAAHVRRELGNAVDLILDGGACRVGIESTVISLCQKEPMILRPGGVSRAEIERVIGPVKMFTGSVKAGKAAQSPGQQKEHYRPGVPAYRVSRGQWKGLRDWQRRRRKKAAVLAMEMPERILDALVILMPKDAKAYARRMYAALHEAEASGAQTIWVQMPPRGPRWDAVRDRLMRATKVI